MRESSGPCLCGDPECGRCFPQSYSERACKHGTPTIGVCEHCLADSEIMEEKIERVVMASSSVATASSRETRIQAEGYLRDALRDLVREVRR